MKTVTGNTVLSVADISVDIGPAKILQHVSFSTCNGDMLAIMGPTGSGKTSLLNAIAGNQPLTAGHIYLSGQQFDKRLRRRLGFVIQQDVFFSNLTLWETLYVDKLKRLENVIDLLQLRKCENTAIGDIFNKGLSGGEKKRTSIACTLLTDPDILLLDEPTSGLDSSMTLGIVKQLKTLASEYNKTVLVTIHQPSSQAYHMFDSLLLLAQGKVVYNGGAHREPLNFLEQFGYICDPLYNPADFMMDVLSSDDVKLNESVNRGDIFKKGAEIRNATDLIHGNGLSTILTAVRSIGDIFNKGLSGGEKKRTSIACTLLTDPDILLLDEPTSGLDSSMTLGIVKQLKALASEYNKTVLVTIHQPSSQAYHMFDSLLLLAQGKVVYNGGAHREPLNFLEQFGYICDPLYNPADFMMDVLSSDDVKPNESVNRGDIFKKGAEIRNATDLIHGNGLSTILTAVRYSSSSLVSITTDDSSIKVPDIDRWPTGFSIQFRMLMWRSFKQSRKRVLYLYSIILYIILGVITGLLMSDNVKVFRNIMGVVFYVICLWAYGAAQQATATFPAEIEVVSRDRASGAYRLSAYYLSKIASETPLTVALPTLFYTAVYWISRLRGVREFFITWSILLLDIVSIQGLGLLVSIVFTDRQLSFVVLQGVLHFSLLVGGFVIQDFPQWLVWMKYFSHMHYPISAMCIVLYENAEPVSCNITAVAKFPKCLQNSLDNVTSTDILHDAGIGLPVYFYVGVMALTCVTLRIAVYVALRLRRPQIK